MIDPDKRKAIWQLYREGMPKREICRRLHISRMTVQAIIKNEGETIHQIRSDKIEVDPDLLVDLFAQCDGFVQRVHEKLMEEHGVDIGYSTLTRQVRQLKLRHPEKRVAAQVPDMPGEEMQHDTTVYHLKIGSSKLKVVASLIYYRYSKIRYLKFYRTFNRFRMQCFFHEALTFFGYTARDCIIDNTSLARLSGSGKNARIHPEMEQFARKYGFRFLCHEIGHSDRKAGNERSFYTVETNFIVGRTFADLDDLNRQAYQWSTVRMANRPLTKSRIIPKDAFETEKPYLTKLFAAVTPPYLPHERICDQYGYVAFNGNYYWVPLKPRHKALVLEYACHIRIFHNREELLTYELPKDGIKNLKFTPKGQPPPPYQPKHRKKPTENEEKDLRNVNPAVDGYLDVVLKHKGTNRHRFIRELYHLKRKTASSLFIQAIKRAAKYRIFDMKTIESIVSLQMTDGSPDLSAAIIDETFCDRQAYLDGQYGSEVDLSMYDNLLEDENDE